jgi:hypothetical protein
MSSSPVAGNAPRGSRLPGNCYEEVGIWVVQEWEENPARRGIAPQACDLGNLGGFGGVCQHELASDCRC